MLEDYLSLQSRKKAIIFKVKKFNNKRCKQWTEQENDLIINQGKLKQKNKWIIASKVLQNRNSLECYYRYQSLNPNIKKGRWTLMEDHKLLILTKLFGKNWKLLSRVLKNRSNRQIKNRYKTILSYKDTEKDFDLEEDLFIMDAYKSFKHLIENENENNFMEMFKEKWKTNRHLIKKSFYEALKRLIFLLIKH